MATITYKDGVRIEGNMAQGKYYRMGARWAKVMSTDYTSGATRVSVAFGVKGELVTMVVREFESFKDNAHRTANRRKAQDQAMAWVGGGIL